MKRLLLVNFSLVLLILAGCAPSPPDQRREVINHTPYTFCKVVETPNLSIYLPWQKKTHRIELPPNGRTVIRDRGREYILRLYTCDDHYMVSNLRHWTELGEPWVLTEDMVLDMKATGK